MTEDGHAFRIYILYSLLTVSKVATKLIPFTFLAALILTILKLDKDNTIREKLEKESVMYQICDHVKELVILTMPMDNKLETFQNKIKEISNEKNVQKLLNQQ